MRDPLQSLDMPVTIVHGLRDTLVPPENVTYLLGLLPRRAQVRVFLVEDGDHFLPWSHPDLLSTALECLLSDLSPAASDPGPEAAEPR
jgi:pimeloyl-ACP methyl ester carboxylesterase